MLKNSILVIFTKRIRLSHHNFSMLSGELCHLCSDYLPVTPIILENLKIHRDTSQTHTQAWIQKHLSQKNIRILTLIN